MARPVFARDFGPQSGVTQDKSMRACSFTALVASIGVRGFCVFACCRGRAVAASKKTSFASLAQSTLCLGSVMAPGRFAR